MRYAADDLRVNDIVVFEGRVWRVRSADLVDDVFTGVELKLETQREGGTLTRRVHLPRAAKLVVLDRNAGDADVL